MHGYTKNKEKSEDTAFTDSLKMQRIGGEGGLIKLC